MHYEFILVIGLNHPIVATLMIPWSLRQGLEGLRAEECGRE